MKKIIDFWAPWCKACKDLEPILEEASKNVEVIRINVDEDPGSVNDYQVMSLPTVILFDEVKGINRITGSSLTNIERIRLFAGL